ncbi:hypothetical protein E2C01_062799 [Portunus trituberculatus]|uniref:Uncharacterized protein n=1 Tax=Portunus trituberculatus TaxID=210409 RepID=A0A5B7HH26_PORTR|nr:hypothetical protein [Portunus trituberculatus]
MRTSPQAHNHHHHRRPPRCIAASVSTCRRPRGEKAASQAAQVGCFTRPHKKTSCVAHNTHRRHRGS